MTVERLAALPVIRAGAKGPECTYIPIFQEDYDRIKQSPPWPPMDGPFDGIQVGSEIVEIRRHLM